MLLPNLCLALLSATFRRSVRIGPFRALLPALFFASFLVLSAEASAQQRSAVEEQINDAMVTLRAHSHVFFQLTGSEQTGTKVVNLTYNISCEIDTDSTGNVTGAFIDVEAMHNGQLVHRICGDGVTLWKYNPWQNSYQPIRYGVENGPKPTNYLDSFLRKLGSISDIYEGRVATILRQTYAEAGTNYQSWIPSVQPTSATGTIIYLDGSPAKQALVFTLSADTNGNFGLSTLDYFDHVQVGELVRSSIWHMTVNKDLQYLPATFVFVPPAHSRVIN